MKNILLYLLSVIIGIAIGLFSLNITLNGFGQANEQSEHTINIDHWITDPRFGSQSADAKTRAQIAKVGILALNRSETIYFTRDIDDEGQRFEEHCTYQITGGSLPARWWSVTLYDEDHYLARNKSNAYSITQTQVLNENHDGTWTAQIGKFQPQKEHWLSSENAGQLSLTVRLYNPHPDALDDLSTLKLPSIKRLSCEGAEQ